jgi:hypothetical protein
VTGFDALFSEAFGQAHLSTILGPTAIEIDQSGFGQN